MSLTISERIETEGLSSAGIWVRRWREPVSVTDEIWALANVLQTWNLNLTMSLGTYESAYVEISGPDLQPMWVYLIELVGHRIAEEDTVITNHPLSRVNLGDKVRVLAVVDLNATICLGALIETSDSRRMICVMPDTLH